MLLAGRKGPGLHAGAGTGRNFWLLDLGTMKSRPLTRVDNPAMMRTFDIAPDGRRIVFERLRENSNIVPIDRHAKP